MAGCDAYSMVLCFAVELAAKRMGQVIHSSSAQQSATVIYMIYYAINHIFEGGAQKVRLCALDAC